MEEYTDLYDIHGQKINQSCVRGSELPQNTFRSVVHVCVFNSKNQMLIQKRVHNKSLWPGVWDLTAGGSALCGEFTQQAASRELFEEMGIEHDFSSDRPYVTMHFFNGFDDYYVLKKDIDTNTLVYQPTEVEQSKWASCEEICQMIDNNQFIPYKKTLIMLLFECLRCRGLNE
jgi:isopentenyldiphosphate isomerase